MPGIVAQLATFSPPWLAKKTQVVLMIAALAVIGAVSAVIYRAIDRDLTEAAFSRRQSLSYLTAITLSEKFDRAIDIAVSLATRVRFRQLVDEGKWDEAMEILREVPRNFPFVERVFLAEPAGTLMADVPALAGVRGKNFSDRDWFRGLNRQWQPYVSNVYRRAAEPRWNVVAIAVPVKGERSPRAILVLQVKLDTFFDWLKGLDIGQDGFVYVVDRAGVVAYHPKLPPQGELHDLSAAPTVREVLRGGRGVRTFVDPTDGEARLVAYQPIAKYGWGVVVEQPASAAFAAKERLLTSALVAFAFVLILLVLAVYLIVRLLAQTRQSEVDRRANVELERRVAERTVQLEAVNKELEGFSYSVSHDLRAPLRAIEGFSRILEDDYRERLDDEGRRQIGVIRTNCHKMAQLIDDMLAFARLSREPLRAVPVNMTALAREVIGELQAESVVQLASLPDVQGDRAMLRQVWINLISNAVKFTRATVESRIEIGGETGQGEVMYYVKDNGAGFNMLYYDKLFGVFQRLHGADEFPGTGVGLAIVQRVLMRHGGRVWAMGKENEGATFYFALPPVPQG
jgi:signal transduction histidine kinase